MSVYIDEALLDAAGLTDFPEFYAYIREREPRPPVETASPVPIGEQTLQEQVKINADILENSNEAFLPPEPNMPVKIDYGQQIVNKPFIFYETQPTLIVNGDRVTLNCFVAINSNIKLFCYIDENGPYVQAENELEIDANTFIVISTTYYKQFEAFKQINYDLNNDGKVDIMDVWNGSGQSTHEAQSHVYDIVKKQSELVENHIDGTVLHNFLNNDIKLIDKLEIYKAGRAACYIQDGPVVTFSFGTKLGDNAGNVYKIFSTIDSKILPPYAKYHAIHPDKIKSVVPKVGKGLSWVNDKIVKPIVLPAAKQFSGFLPGGGLIMKGIEAGSSTLDAFNGYGSKQYAKDKFTDLMDDPYLCNLPIESLRRLIKLHKNQQ
ncbi:MAG: hypothetical protein EZS28_014985 [Streblomastix strix]|uniref:EF-hand domain-containing protein n=1 Tax=Streblomastix strix TaxID=222440 RepID=A0A5J4W3T3_9EUKA|nr:MAG: hypothetical protein EZS28_014985 [Streblomastix strix]